MSAVYCPVSQFISECVGAALRNYKLEFGSNWTAGRYDGADGWPTAIFRRRGLLVRYSAQSIACLTAAPCGMEEEECTRDGESRNAAVIPIPTVGDPRMTGSQTNSATCERRISMQVPTDYSNSTVHTKPALHRAVALRQSYRRTHTLKPTHRHTAAPHQPLDGAIPSTAQPIHAHTDS